MERSPMDRLPPHLPQVCMSGAVISYVTIDSGSIIKPSHINYSFSVNNQGTASKKDPVFRRCYSLRKSRTPVPNRTSVLFPSSQERPALSQPEPY